MRTSFLLALTMSFGAMQAAPAAAATFEISGNAGSRLLASEIAEFDEPWAMTFLPDSSLLVTTKPGRLFHVTQAGEKTEVEGMWEVAYGGQGGLGDVVLHPEFTRNGLVYISNAENGDGGTRGAVVWRARLDRSGAVPRLTEVERIWTQEPKVTGRGHYSHRMVFGSDGMLYISAGERQKQEPAQDLGQALGKIIRLNPDGSVPDGNPWQREGDLARSFWSMGHRNMLGLALDTKGRLWAHEMGPRGGDELNLIVRGDNYGWPVVSYGRQYSGVDIPDHETRPEFNAPEAYWVPSISPAGLIFYDGALFPDWHGDALIGALSGQALIRVDIADSTAREAERFSWGERVREVEQGPEGALWVLEDGGGGRLLRLTPAR